VSKFFQRGDDLERELRRNRPEPRAEFLASMVDKVGRERRSTAPRLRLGFAGALTTMIVVSLGAFGGLSYAASAVQSVAHVVTKVVTPSAPHVAKAPQAPLSSAAAQYPKPIKICHFDKRGEGHTQTIDEGNWPAFRSNGDHKGKCDQHGEFKPGSAAAKAAAKKKKNAKGVLGTTRRGVNPSSTG
jgi:hypothetical protein